MFNVTVLPVWPSLWRCVFGLWPLVRWLFSLRTEGKALSYRWLQRSWERWAGSCWWCCICSGSSLRSIPADWTSDGWTGLKGKSKGGEPENIWHKNLELKFLISWSLFIMNIVDFQLAIKLLVHPKVKMMPSFTVWTSNLYELDA